MAANTANLEDYTVLSSLSLNGSGSTVKAVDVVATTVTASTISQTGNSSFATITALAAGVGAGAAIGPTLYVTSEASLGLYRSAASTLALSYGTFSTAAGGLLFKTLVGSAFTAGSSVTTSGIADGAFRFSILSLTTNGAEIAFRSGNSVWKFASVDIG